MNPQTMFDHCHKLFLQTLAEAERGGPRREYNIGEAMGLALAIAYLTGAASGQIDRDEVEKFQAECQGIPLRGAV